jgi:hypothetical protein
MSGKDREGSVVGELAGLFPLAGRLVGRRVREWVGESRASLRETIREVRRELQRELDATPGRDDESGSADPSDALPEEATPDEKKDASE